MIQEGPTAFLRSFEGQLLNQWMLAQSKDAGQFWWNLSGINIDRKKVDGKMFIITLPTTRLLKLFNFIIQKLLSKVSYNQRTISRGTES